MTVETVEQAFADQRPEVPYAGQSCHAIAQPDCQRFVVESFGVLIMRKDEVKLPRIHAQLALEIALSNWHASRAKNVVGGDRMEVKVRQQK